MSDGFKIKGFPDPPSKPVPKRSLFERQRAEAEAKRARDQAETAAVYEDFVKSFEDTGASHAPTGSAQRQTAYHHGAPTMVPPGGPSKRHFTGKSSMVGSLGPPPLSMSRKRMHDGFQRDRDSSRSEGTSGPRDAASAFQDSDDGEVETANKEEERAAAKPTLHLSSLPPGTSPAAIKALIPPVLTVDSVKILPPSNHGSGERRVWSAIVTLAQETAASDMDTVVSSLQNKYLGWGYYLSISRHLSSAAIHSAIPMTAGTSSLNSQPFGARPAPHGHVSTLSRAPPPGSHRFAPPSSYDAGYGGRYGSAFQVNVKPPSDLRQLKLIHKTLENLLTYGPEFEALLMSRPEVQKEEKWAWIWDSRSTGGVWYRWKLWDILTRPKKAVRGRRGRQPLISIFDHGPSWTAPEKDLKFEYITKIDDFVSDEDYDSSEEEDSDREDERGLNEGANENSNDGMGHLNPLQRAKLAHLLARLPTANSRLRRGDVARVTAFAIKHAGEGAEEVVEMVVTNVEHPFAYSSANPEWSGREMGGSGENQESGNDGGNNDADEIGATSTKPSHKEKLDTSAAKLVGLYVISDILSSSSTSGVRHAWRYRQLFENAFKAHKTFEHLGRVEKELGWGRLKAEKWRRSIGVLLNLWEGWCVFPQSSHEYFVQSFEKPPPTEKELEEERQHAEAQKTTGVFGGKGKSKWRAVDDTAPVEHEEEAHATNAMDVDGTPMAPEEENLDGEPMSDIDGVPMEDSDMDVDGTPLEEDIVEEEQIQEKVPTLSPSTSTQGPEPQRKRRPRPKAEDMFADSESEQEG
ncbi:hypothetical protein VTO42DRAFT_3425 [Malbranchea cinnamomea]